MHELFGEHGAFVWISLAATAIGIASELWALRKRAKALK